MNVIILAFSMPGFSSAWFRFKLTVDPGFPTHSFILYKLEHLSDSDPWAAAC